MSMRRRSAAGAVLREPHLKRGAERKLFSTLPKLMHLDLFNATPQQGQLPKVQDTHPHRVKLGTDFIPYQLRRTKRRSIGFLIDNEGLRVTAPRWVSLAEINEAILSKQRWILAKLQEQRSRPAPVIEKPTLWTTGAQLPFLGHTATLRIDYGAPTFFDSTTGLITLNLPSDAAPTQCKKHLQAWLMSQARRQFSLRLPHFADQLGVQYHSFALTSAHTRWGSCNSQGKIRLNWRLIHVSPHLIDYVIAHELAHLHEMNHSPRFWATVERVYPEYVMAREELKKLGLKGLPQF